LAQLKPQTPKEQFHEGMINVPEKGNFLWEIFHWGIRLENDNRKLELHRE